MAQRLPVPNNYGAKMFAWARDTAANVMYYVMGKSASFLRRECYQPTALPDTFGGLTKFYAILFIVTGSIAAKGEKTTNQALSAGSTSAGGMMAWLSQ